MTPPDPITRKEVRQTGAGASRTSGGVVYLLHFERPYRHAGHYLGWTENLDARLERHRAGSGARLLAVITEAGIGWTVARTWAGDRRLERQLKGRGGHRRICPTCRGDHA